MTEVVEPRPSPVEPATRVRWRWSEFAWALAFAAALAAFTTLPYVWAAASTKGHMQYLGFVFNPDEPNVHLSWIRQAIDGAVFFDNQFTSEPHVGRFFNLFMLGAGRAAARFGLEAYEIWAVARVVSILLLGLVCYFAVAHWTQVRRRRRWSVVLIGLASGLGWYEVAGGLDWSPAFDALPLVATLLLLMGIAWGERALRDGDWIAAGGAAAAGLLLRGAGGLDAMLLVVCLLVYLLILYLNGASLEPAELWPGALILLAACPPWDVPAPVPVGTISLVLCAILGYGLVLLLAGRAGWARARFVAVAAAGLLLWAAFGGGPGLDTIDVEPGLVMPEAISFLTIYLNPLFASSVAFLVLSLVLGQRALRDGDLRYAAGSGVAGLVLANIHTYDAIPLLGTLTVYLVALVIADPERRNARLGAFGLILVLILPAIWYQWQLIQSQPLYREKANTPTPTPPLPAMLVSFGFLVPLALYGAMTELRVKGRRAWFLVGWLLVHGAVIWLPLALFPFQRKMAEGLHVVLAVLATAGLFELAERVSTWLGGLETAGRLREVGAVWAVRADQVCRRGAWVTPLLWLGLVALVPSNLLFVQDTVVAVRRNNEAKLGAAMPPFYVSDAEWRAIRWMGEYLPSDAVIGCLPWIGNYLPGRIGRTVYCGHWAETIDFSEKFKAFAGFLREAESAQEKMKFLQDSRIGYVYFGEFEHLFTGGQLPQLPQLERIYPEQAPPDGEPPAVEIYRVMTPQEAAAAAAVGR